MRTSSRVLGIVGGIFAILFATMFLIFSLFLAQLIDFALRSIDISVEDPNISWHGYEITYDGHTITVDSDTFELYIKNMENLVGTATHTSKGILNVALLSIAIISYIGGVLGIFAGISVRRKNTSSGIMMVCAGVLSFVTVIGAFASVLLIIGGFLALVPIRQDRQPFPETTEPTQSV